MSAGERPQKAEFEQALDRADAKVAEFKPEAEPPLKKLQNALHSHPTAIPAIVLIVRGIFREKELKMQINAAWVLIPFILRALMLA